MSGFWKEDIFGSHSKTIAIRGPGTLYLNLDYDDVDHDEVDEAMPRIIEALNKEWSKNG